MKVTEVKRVTEVTIKLEYNEVVQLRAALGRLKRYTDQDNFIHKRYSEPSDYGQSDLCRKHSADFLMNLHNELKSVTEGSV